MTKADRIRFGVFFVFIIAAFAALIIQLANLQIRGSDDYGAIAESNMTKRIVQRGSRGQILDVNGTLLAYDKKIYNVQFYRQPGSNREQNGRYSKAIWEVISTLRKDGMDVDFGFYLKRGEDGNWYFDTGTTNESVAAARERMFRSNFYVSSLDVNEIYDRLCYNYMINEIDEDFPAGQKLTLTDKLAVLSVWQEMQMNAFNSVPITVASDINWATVIELETRMINLDGMSISVTNQRVYPKGTLACHILGYTGLMQSTAQIDEYLSKGYKRNDTIGLDGVEKSMEEWLTPNSSLRSGYTLVEINRTGRTVRTLETIEPQDGNTVKLTIDADLQAVAEQALYNTINSIRDYEERLIQTDGWMEENKETLLEYEANDRTIKLAQTGAVVVLDMQCRVLALASAPNFDPNLFIIGMNDEQRERMLLDPRNPLYNNAISAADTPGSVFKMCTALAALYNKVLTVSETISDEGYFTKYDDTNPPKCWITLRNRYKHADQTVVEGLTNSCNYFFYTIADRLGADGNALHEFASKLGLTSRTNIDLPGETVSVVGSQISLYDPSRPITGLAQDTWYPVQVKNSIKRHLLKIGEEYGITYSDERLETCIKNLMDMAVETPQTEWVRSIRPILMQDLGMSMEMVYLQKVVGDIYLALNEIKWGGTYTIMTAIGQSITTVTPVAMARYVAAVANGGRVYDVQLIDSIVAPDGRTINKFDPVLVNDLSYDVAEYIPYIKEGMKGVVDPEGDGTAGSYFDGWVYSDEIAGKTGTAETSDLDVEDNSWFVCFAPYEKPEIAVVVYIPYGYSGARSSLAARQIVEYYLDNRNTVEEETPAAPNALAP